jgi:hypothetical protein
MAGADDTPDVWVRPDPPNPLRASHGLQVGVRLAVAHPGGQPGQGAPATTPSMGELAEAWAPLGLDVGYRFNPYVYFGGTLLWGATFGDDSAVCAACGFRYDFQALTELRLYPAPEATVNPWFGVGIGWELMHLNFVSEGPTGTANYQGPVLGNFEIGLDVRRRAVAIGPYFGVELAEFALRNLDPTPPHETSSIGAHALHEWFTLGLRASYGP